MDQKLTTLVLVPALVLLTVLGSGVIFLEEALGLVSMLVHESGHALMGWVCGWPAIPTFIFMTIQLTERGSLFWAVIFASVLGLGLYYSWVRKFFWLFGVCSVLFLAVVVCSAFLNPKTQEEAILMAGLGGELLLSLVFITAGFLEFPADPRWQAWKRILTTAGTVVFTQAAILWIHARTDAALLPMGALLDFGALSGGESTGDLDRLIREFGWTTQSIQALGYRTAVACLACVVAVYGYGVFDYARTLNSEE